MEEHLKLFQDHSEYQDFASGDTMVRPNVSYCVEQNEVHYNPIEHNNIVTYTSFEEMPVNSYGINPNEFCATFVSHEYNEQTGVGVLTFASDVTCALSINDATGDKLRSITLPRTVEQISINIGHAFESLTIKALTPPSIVVGYPGFNENVIIYVPAEAVNDYKANEYWSQYAAQIQPIR